MSFQALFNSTITISRLATGVGQRRLYTPYITAKCMIQPTSPSDSQIDHESWGSTYKCFALNSAQIREGDRAVDQLGADYRVTGVRSLMFGTTPHLEILLTRENSTINYTVSSSGQPVGLLLALLQT